jgi:hypothetical protein
MIVNTEPGFGSLTIVKGVERLISISHTDIEEGHQQHSIEHIIFTKLCQQIPIELLDMEVKSNFIPVH